MREPRPDANFFRARPAVIMAMTQTTGATEPRLDPGTTERATQRPGAGGPGLGELPETDANAFVIRSFTTVATDIPVRLASGRGVTGSRKLRVGDSEVEIATQEGHLPTRQTDLADRDLLHVTAGEHVGRWLRVVEASAADQQTARRVPVVEDQKPEVL